MLLGLQYRARMARTVPDRVLSSRWDGAIFLMIPGTSCQAAQQALAELEKSSWKDYYDWFEAPREEAFRLAFRTLDSSEERLEVAIDLIICISASPTDTGTDNLLCFPVS
jgi:hypothetical protein